MQILTIPIELGILLLVIAGAIVLGFTLKFAKWDNEPENTASENLMQSTILIQKASYQIQKTKEPTEDITNQLTNQIQQIEQLIKEVEVIEANEERKPLSMDQVRILFDRNKRYDGLI